MTSQNVIERLHSQLTRLSAVAMPFLSTQLAPKPGTIESACRPNVIDVTRYCKDLLWLDDLRFAVSLATIHSVVCVSSLTYPSHRSLFPAGVRSQFFLQNWYAKIACLDALHHAELQDLHDLLHCRASLQRVLDVTAHPGFV